MLLEIKHYELRPRDIEAVQWDGTEEQAREIIGWIESWGGWAKFYPRNDLDYWARSFISIGVKPSATVSAYKGGFIIREGGDLFSFMPPAAFGLTWKERI